MIHDMVYGTFWRRKRDLFGIPALAVAAWLLVLAVLNDDSEGFAFLAILCNGFAFALLHERPATFRTLRIMPAPIGAYYRANLLAAAAALCVPWLCTFVATRADEEARSHATMLFAVSVAMFYAVVVLRDVVLFAPFTTRLRGDDAYATVPLFILGFLGSLYAAAQPAGPTYGFPLSSASTLVAVATLAAGFILFAFHVWLGGRIAARYACVRHERHPPAVAPSPRYRVSSPLVACLRLAVTPRGLLDLLVLAALCLPWAFLHSLGATLFLACAFAFFIVSKPATWARETWLILLSTPPQRRRFHGATHCVCALLACGITYTLWGAMSPGSDYWTDKSRELLATVIERNLPPGILDGPDSPPIDPWRLDFDNPYAIWPAEEGLPKALADAERLSVRLWGVGIDEAALAHAWEHKSLSEQERKTRFFRTLDTELGRAGLAAADACAPLLVCAIFLVAILSRDFRAVEKALPVVSRGVSVVIPWCIVQSLLWDAHHHRIEPFIVKYVALPLRNYPLAFLAIALALLSCSTYLAYRADPLCFAELPRHSPGRKP